VINPLRDMLSYITTGVLVELHDPLEIRREVLLFFLDLCLRSQLIVEWIPVLFFEPWWNLSVGHVIDLHFPRHYAEQRSSKVGDHSYIV
jgi:hypothetical protein